MLAVMAAAGASAALGAGSRFVTDTIHSAILGAPRAYTVLLPESYDSDTTRTYPVVYLLHGLYGQNDNWQTHGGLKAVTDLLVKSGRADEMIVVTPTASGKDIDRVFSGYYDMPGCAYEQFFFGEFMPMVEKRFRVKADKEHRAIGGLSMGGGGSVGYAQKHPEMFAAVYAMSAHVDPAGVERGDKVSEKVRLFDDAARRNSPTDFILNADEATRRALRTVRWYVDCGDDDYLLDGNLRFYQGMKRAGVPCELRVRDGSHTWEYWHTALYDALPFFSRSFGKH